MNTSCIALLAPYLPAPAHSGGRIRIHRFAEALAKHFDVHLFAAVDEYEIRENLKTPELGAYAAVHIELKRQSLFPWLGRPRRVRTVSPRRLVRAFLDADRCTPFKAAVVEHSHAASTLQYGRRIPWLLDEHNVESDYADARSRALKCPLNAFRGRELAGLRRWEESLWKAASEVVCVSSQDARRVEVVRGRPAPVIPNGVCPEEVPFKKPSERTGFDILFVGILEHPPNAAAARWLAREVLPRVLQEEPRARLILCGARPAREVLELAGERIIVTGRVASVTPYLESASVYANALKQGAGSSLKVLEALASGIPLVSTTVGARGFELRSPEHYLGADDTASFVGNILECFRDRKARDAAAERGRSVAESCSWDKLSTRFVELVQRVAYEPATDFATAPTVLRAT
ncbi:MAG TPA: glycosyltransferase family 4 protein [Polyangiaceae bacterium]|nr:glycosyltransferase family 4 protein [Polyangiaceae bacterium]